MALASARFARSAMLHLQPRNNNCASTMKGAPMQALALAKRMCCSRRRLDGRTQRAGSGSGRRRSVARAADAEEDGASDAAMHAWDVDDGGGAKRRFDCGVHAWGRSAATIAERVLEENFETLRLYAIEVETTHAQVHVVLDELSSDTGSPGLEDIVSFSNLYRSEWEDVVDAQQGRVDALQGEEREGGGDGAANAPPSSSSSPPSSVIDGPILPDDFELTTSSPGAEREIEGPDEMRRFRRMPMRVDYEDSLTGEDAHQMSEVLQLEWLSGDASDPSSPAPASSTGVDGLSLWHVANVKHNRAKGRAQPPRKQRDRRIWLRLGDISRMRLHLDVG